MKTVQILRNNSDLQGTPGVLQTSGFSCLTLELPWRDNISQLSCIPAGTYKCVWNYSPAFKRHMYQVLDVPKRSGIRIHSGTWAGAKDKGYKSHVLGCILLGKSFGKHLGQKAIFTSKVTVSAFENHMGHEPFLLEIVNLWEKKNA